MNPDVFRADLMTRCLITFPLGFLLHDFLLFLGSRDSVLQQKRAEELGAV